MQFWKGASWGSFMCSYLKFGQVVQKEMLFKEKAYGRQMQADYNSSPWAFSSVELKMHYD